MATLYQHTTTGVLMTSPSHPGPGWEEVTKAPAETPTKKTAAKGTTA